MNRKGIIAGVLLLCLLLSGCGQAGAAAPAQGAAESGYGELFQNIYDAAIVTDLHGRVRDANRRAVASFGYSVAQFSHLVLGDLVSGADADLVRTLHENLRRETFSILQASCTRSDGSQFPAEIAVSPLRLSTPHLCFLVRDETRRRQEGEMLRTEHNALQNASDAIVVVAHDTRIEYANPATARIWGFATAGELVGRPLGDLLANPDDGRVIVDSLSGEVYDTSGDALARRADGEPFRVEVRASCNRDSDGNVIGAVLSLSDLTDRDRVLAAERDAGSLRASIARLEELYRSARYNVEELAALLSAAGNQESAAGNVAALRSLSSDAEEIFAAVAAGRSGEA